MEEHGKTHKQTPTNKHTFSTQTRVRQKSRAHTIYHASRRGRPTTLSFWVWLEADGRLKWRLNGTGWWLWSWECGWVTVKMCEEPHKVMSLCITQYEGLVGVPNIFLPTNRKIMNPEKEGVVCERLPDDKTTRTRARIFAQKTTIVIIYLPSRRFASRKCYFCGETQKRTSWKKADIGIVLWRWTSTIKVARDTHLGKVQEFWIHTLTSLLNQTFYLLY